MLWVSKSVGWSIVVSNSKTVGFQNRFCPWLSEKLREITTSSEVLFHGHEVVEEVVSLEQSFEMATNWRRSLFSSSSLLLWSFISSSMVLLCWYSLISSKSALSSICWSTHSKSLKKERCSAEIVKLEIRHLRISCVCIAFGGQCLPHLHFLSVWTVKAIFVAACQEPWAKSTRGPVWLRDSWFTKWKKVPVLAAAFGLHCIEKLLWPQLDSLNKILAFSNYQISHTFEPREATLNSGLIKIVDTLLTATLIAGNWR